MISREELEARIEDAALVNYGPTDSLAKMKMLAYEAGANSLAEVVLLLSEALDTETNQMGLELVQSENEGTNIEILLNHLKRRFKNLREAQAKAREMLGLEDKL